MKDADDIERFYWENGGGENLHEDLFTIYKIGYEDAKKDFSPTDVDAEVGSGRDNERGIH